MADTSANADEDPPQPMETEDETKLDNNARGKLVAFTLCACTAEVDIKMVY